MSEAQAFLPLKSDVFLILLVLAEGDSYGYALMQEVDRLSGGQVVLQAGALYRRLRWMLEEGLLEELDERPVADTDERRRYYGITALGRAVLRAEASRMRGLVGVAESLRVLPRRN